MNIQTGVKSIAIPKKGGSYIYSKGPSSSSSSSSSDSSVSDFIGASEDRDGVHGLVIQPLSGDQSKFLRGDATWSNVFNNITEDSSGNIVIDGSTFTVNSDETVFNNLVNILQDLLVTRLHVDNISSKTENQAIQFDSETVFNYFAEFVQSVLIDQDLTVEGDTFTKNLVTENLTVTKLARFFELIIDKIQSVGGQVILSPANAVIDKVEDIEFDFNEKALWTYMDSDRVSSSFPGFLKDKGGIYGNIHDNLQTLYYSENSSLTGHVIRLYWKARKDNQQITNNFSNLDQVICQTFNREYLKEDTHLFDVSNKYYWFLIPNEQSDSKLKQFFKVLGSGYTEIDGQQEYCNYIQFIATNFDEWSASLDSDSRFYRKVFDLETGELVDETHGLTGFIQYGYDYDELPNFLSFAASNYFANIPSEIDIDYDGEFLPEAGDNLSVLGSRDLTDSARQSAILLSAYQGLDLGIEPPYIAFYRGIQTFDLASYRYNWFAANETHISGEDITFSTGQTIPELIDEKIIDVSISVPTITGKEVHYQVSADGSEPPTGEWSTTMPVVSKGNFLWTRITIHYSDGRDIVTYTTTYYPTMNIVNQVVEYQVSDQGQTIPTGDWSLDMPLVSKGYYLWTRITVTYQDGTEVVTYTTTYYPQDGVAEDAEYYILDPVREEFVVDKDKNSAVILSYDIIHVIGEVNEKIEPDLAGYHVEGKITDSSDQLIETLEFEVGVSSSAPYTSSVIKTFSDEDYLGYRVYVWLANNEFPVDGTRRVVVPQLLPGAVFEIADSIVLSVQGSILEIQENVADVSSGLGAVSAELVTVQNNISQLEIKSDQISSTVTQHTTKIDELEGEIVSEETIHSMIEQRADSIKLEVYDEFNEKTGIDVSSGHITLDADNTTINGDLSLRNTDQGLVIYNDYGEKSVMIQNRTIPNVNAISDVQTVETIHIGEDDEDGSFVSDYKTEFYLPVAFEEMNTHTKSMSIDNLQVQVSDKLGHDITNKVSTVQCILSIGAGSDSSLEKVLFTWTRLTENYSYTTDYQTYITDNSLYGTVTYNGLAFRVYFSENLIFDSININIDISKTTSDYMLVGTNGFLSNRGLNQYLYYGNAGFEVRDQDEGFSTIHDGNKQIIGSSGNSIDDKVIWGSMNSLYKVQRDPVFRNEIIRIPGRSQFVAPHLDLEVYYQDSDILIPTANVEPEENFYVKLPVNANISGKVIPIKTGRVIKILNRTNRRFSVYVSDSGRYVLDKDMSTGHYLDLEDRCATSFIFDGQDWYRTE